MKRVKYIDVAKFAGIALVLLDHVQYYVTVNAYFMKVRVIWIAFFLTVFFWASGMVFKEVPPKKAGDILKFLIKKVQAILVPYILWCFLLNYSGNHDIYFFKCIFQGTVNSLESVGVNSVLWFFPSFFLANIFTYIVVLVGNCIFSGRGKGFFYSCCAVLVSVISVLLNQKCVENMYFGMRSALVGSAFMLLGMVFKRMFEYIYIKFSYGVKFACGVVTFLIGVPIAFFNMPPYLAEDGNVVYYYAVWMAQGHFGRNILLFLVEGVLFCTSIFLLSMCLEKVKLFSYIGQRTMVLMASHIIVFSIVALHAPLGLKNFFNGGNAINYVSFWLCSIAIIVVIMPVIDYFFPFLYRPAKRGNK